MILKDVGWRLKGGGGFKVEGRRSNIMLTPFLTGTDILQPFSCQKPPSIKKLAEGVTLGKELTRQWR